MLVLVMVWKQLSLWAYAVVVILASAQVVCIVAFSRG